MPSDKTKARELFAILVLFMLVVAVLMSMLPITLERDQTFAAFVIIFIIGGCFAGVLTVGSMLLDIWTKRMLDRYEEHHDDFH